MYIHPLTMSDAPYRRSEDKFTKRKRERNASYISLKVLPQIKPYTLYSCSAYQNLSEKYRSRSRSRSNLDF